MISAFVRNARAVSLITIVAAVSLASGCHSAQKAPSVVLVNAPANGVIRSVLVGEGATVEQGVALVEIAVQPDQASQVETQRQNKKSRSDSSDLTAAEAEAGRAEAEVKRIAPLVSRGYASQSELDGARAKSQDAQARLQRARDNANKESKQQPSAGASGSEEQIVSVRAPSAGVVSAISARVGQRVTTGQPIASVVART